MSDGQRQNWKKKLVTAIAVRKPVAAWARENKVSRRTAYRWAKDPRVKAAVDARRRKAVDHSVGVLTGRLARAANCIADLGESADSGSVRLRALRWIFSGPIAMSKFAVLKRRMSAIKEELHERTGNAGPACPGLQCSLVYTCSQNPKKAPFCLIFSRAQDASQGGERAPHLISSSSDPIWAASSRRVIKRHGARAPEGAR